MSQFADPVDLTITFTPLPDGAAVRWESPVLGVRRSRMVLPYRGKTLALVLRALDLAQSLHNPQLVFSDAEQSLLAALGLWHPGGWVFPHAYQLVGRMLYQALAEDLEGAHALRTVRDYATAHNRALALNLRMPPDAPELAAQPWELLWDHAPLPLLLSRGRAGICTRYLELAQALPPPRIVHQVPLRILALAPQAGIPAHVREEERQARLVAWAPLLAKGHVVMQEISHVTREALVDALQTPPLPDVIHYYGHGRYLDGKGALLLDAPDGGQHWTEASALAALVGGVRMVTLFACQGAAADPASDLFLGVAPALSAAGVPIVMGMQFTVRVRAATRASGVMYRALVAGWSVQHAVSLVRQALYVEENDRASWYVPVLYVRAHDTHPVYLIAPPTAQERPAKRPPVSPMGARQVVRARQNSRISGVTMQGSDQTDQAVQATEHSAVERASLRAEGKGQQEIEAESFSEIQDSTLDANR